jgi:hypothetical protein
MRGHFCLTIALGACAVGFMVGCAGNVAPDEGGTLTHKTPPPVGSDSTVDETPITATSPARDTVAPGEAYRDVAAVAFADKIGHQWLKQWVINSAGTGYWDRSCPIMERGGPDWANCTSWGPGFYVSELGLPGFGPLSGMSAYLYQDASDGEHTQWIAQTVYNENGDTRMGRVCPIEDRDVVWSLCSEWNKLEFSSAWFNISAAQVFRDEEMLAYKDGTGADVFQHTLFSVDGSLSWSRSCASDGGQPWINPRTCEFGATTPVSDLNIKPGVISGQAGYVYTDALGPVYAQTVFSVSGTAAARRICPITTTGVDWQNCSAFVSERLDNLREYMGPL